MSIGVFLADDHALLRDGLRALLETHADIAVVGTAGSGREAVREVLRLKPQVVLMDIAMPELNGIEAMQKIAARWAEARVVVLSMHATAEHYHRARRAGAWGYLLKESTGAQAVDAVRAVAAGRRYFSRQISEAFDHQEHTASPLESLSGREREILQLVVEGRTSLEIAGIISVSPKTVETYRCRLMQKLKVGDIPALVKFAIQHGITPLK